MERNQAGWELELMREQSGRALLTHSASALVASASGAQGGTAAPATRRQ